jgi:hypothetical protein
VAVVRFVGDPGHDGLQLNEGSLAAAARMIEVHGAATHGRWDAGRRSTVWCFDIERARNRRSVRRPEIRITSVLALRSGREPAR